MRVSHIKMGVGVYGKMDFVEFGQERKPINGKGFLFQHVVFQSIVKNCKDWPSATVCSKPLMCCHTYALEDKSLCV